MSTLNKAMVMGYLGQNPETRYTKEGGMVCNLSIATSEQWKDANGEKHERTDWHRVVLFGKKGQIASEYLEKGNLVYVEGRIQTNKWTDQNGIDRYTTVIIGNNLKMIGGKKSAEEPELTDAATADNSFDDLPF